MSGKTALQREYVDEKVVNLADRLYERVTTDSVLQEDLLADRLLERLQPQLDVYIAGVGHCVGDLIERLDVIEARLAHIEARL
jgi:hypothetical protein